MTDKESVLEKLRKLLALTREGSGATPGEVAFAAAKIQELLAKHRIDAAMLEEGPRPGDGDAGPTRDPSIVDRPVWESAKRQMDTWALNLVAAVARENACYPWYSSGGYGGSPNARVHAIGHEDDLAAVAALSAYLVREVERLADEVRAGGRDARRDRTWMNSFRLGAAREIGERLHGTRERAEAARRQEAMQEDMGGPIEPRDRWQAAFPGATPKPTPGTAFARVESAIERVGARKQKVHEWVKDNRKFRSARRSHAYSEDGFRAGRAAGSNVSLRPGQGRIES